MKPSRSFPRRARRVLGTVVAISAAALAVVAALAVARSVTLRTARTHLSGPSGSRTETIVVNGRGVSVYWLGGETTRHLLCKRSSGCWTFWPPVKVAAGTRPTGAGVRGRLGTLRRGGFTQVTLNGHPVYTFLLDGGRRGVAKGDGVVNFGGPWHVFKG